MRKDAFIKELEYLLQDIPDEEREEAIAYYRDYLEEAGSDNEEKVIEEFGSPERAAALIRAELAGNLKDGGSFTDSGYDDERFKDPNYQIARRLDLPERQDQNGTGQEGKRDEYHTGETNAYQESGPRNGQKENAYQKASEYQGAQAGAYQDAGAGTFQNGGMDSGTGAAGASGQYREKYTRSRVRDPHRERRPWTNGVLKFVLWVIVLILASPFILGALAVVGGLFIGLISVVFGILLGLVCLIVAALVTGIALGALGIASLASLSVLDGLFLLGISFMALGCGLLGTVFMIWFFAVLLPFIWRGIKKLWGILFHRRKEEKAV